MYQSECAFSQNGRSSRASAIAKWGALLAGGTLAAIGLTRKSKTGVAIAAAGGLLAFAGAKSRSTQTRPGAYASLILNTTPEEAYRFWHDFENMPNFNPSLQSVSQIGDRTYRFVAVLPTGNQVRWDAEITSDRPGQTISWRSLPGSDVEVDGLVEFSRASGDRGTLVSASMEYRNTLGGIASAAKLLQRTANFMLRQNMRRAKALIETGEIPTTDGQTHGPRSRVTGIMRALDPSKPPRGDYKVSELVEARRRVS